MQTLENYFVKNADKYPISFVDLKEFLYISYDNPKVKETAENFTKDSIGLQRMLNEVQEKTENRNLKNRIFRLNRRLQDLTENWYSEDSSSIEDSLQVTDVQ